MLNKTIRSTIIVTIQFIVPAALLLILAPQFLNHTHQLNHARDFINKHQLEFLLAHCSFYMALFWMWPMLIKIITARLNSAPDTTQIKTANFARWYLIAAMSFFELLTWWK
jgi:hypothetical protein